MDAKQSNNIENQKSKCAEAEFCVGFFTSEAILSEFDIPQPACFVKINFEGETLRLKEGSLEYILIYSLALRH